MEQQLIERLKKIKLLITDLDGVHTDGSFYVSGFGEFKRFHASDGAAVVLARHAELPIAIISGRASLATQQRIKDLQIPEDLVFEGYMNKTIPYELLLKKFNVTDDEVAYVGDDFIDEPILKRVGAAFSVPNARKEIRDICHYVTHAEGGKGAVREIIELILTIQGRFQPSLDKMRTLYIRDES
ncbi:MAG TPA: 3-deoxy-D-manno-octulosonate 8-phosphate phosphatase [Candidatus Marinimicrobia bacterium]|nr:3-deoxy-D-manno-octulosonate 8-phosphate phosphatase [Candidatus Neomarinimicrobiota bacterium]